MKLLNVACGFIIGLAVFLCLSFLFGGCGPAAESFHATDCKKTPGDLYVYVCDVAPAYARCLDTQGNVKYSECEANGVLCVAECP